MIDYLIHARFSQPSYSIAMVPRWSVAAFHPFLLIITPREDCISNSGAFPTA
jgi:hypothetical protein